MSPDDVWQQADDCVICKVCAGQMRFRSGSDAYFHFVDFHLGDRRLDLEMERRHRPDRLLYPYPHATPGCGSRGELPERGGLVDRGNGFGED